MSEIKEIRGPFTLFDDDSVKEKLTVMTKWEVVIDDGRNDKMPTEQQLEEFLQLGKVYELIVREVGDDNVLLEGNCLSQG